VKLKKLIAISSSAVTLSGAVVSSAFSQQQAPASLTKDIFSPHIETARKLIELITEFIVKYSFQALGGIVVLLISFFIAKAAGRFFGDFLSKHKVDVTISKFLVQMLKIVIIAFAALIALGNFGITIAPFIAGLSVAGFGLSFAMQGPLSNYAAGATLIFTKPFKVGDIIEIEDVMGEVEDMTLACTRVRTVDNTLVVIPNKQIIGEVIYNYSGFKKLDIKIGAAYDSDIDKAIRLVKEVVTTDKRIASKPAPKIGISEFEDSNITIYARIWCRQADYWDVLFDVNKKVRDSFGKEGIEMAFPQRDVHIYNEKNA